MDLEFVVLIGSSQSRCEVTGREPDSALLVEVDLLQRARLHSPLRETIDVVFLVTALHAAVETRDIARLLPPWANATALRQKQRDKVIFVGQLRRQSARGIEYETAVHHRQRLMRHDAFLAAIAGVGISHIEHFQHQHFFIGRVADSVGKSGRRSAR